MARFQIYEGPPGQGKSLYTAKLARSLLERNGKWLRKQTIAYERALAVWEASLSKLRSLGYFNEDRTEQAWLVKNPAPLPPEKRRIASNIKFAEWFEAKYPGWIVYWTKLEELHELRHADLIWDEIATELDARNWPNLSPETMRMLSQYRKRGLDIYANTQDFSMVDVRARLMITSVHTLTKIIGSPDPSATKPAVTRIWGLVLIRQVENWKQINPEKKKYSFFDWSIMLIERELVEMYDTTQDIAHGGYPPMRHIERVCELGDKCTHKDRHKVTHA